MEFKESNNRIWLEDENGKEIAYVQDKYIDKNTIDIQHTVVDPVLQGQGIAGKLIRELTDELHAKGLKAIPTCSYAVKWFDEHPEEQKVLAQSYLYFYSTKTVIQFG